MLSKVLVTLRDSLRDLLTLNTLLPFSIRSTPISFRVCRPVVPVKTLIPCLAVDFVTFLVNVKKYLAKELDRGRIYIAWESSTFHPVRKEIKVSEVAQSGGSRSIKYMFIFIQTRKKGDPRRASTQ